jgi:hypothetical protein
MLAGSWLLSRSPGTGKCGDPGVGWPVAVRIYQNGKAAWLFLQLSLLISKDSGIFAVRLWKKYLWETTQATLFMSTSPGKHFAFTDFADVEEDQDHLLSKF